MTSTAGPDSDPADLSPMPNLSQTVVENRRPKAGSEDSSEHDQGKNPIEAYGDSDQMGLLNDNAAVTTTATAATATTTTTTTSSSRGGSSQSQPTPPLEFIGDDDLGRMLSLWLDEVADTDPERTIHDPCDLNACLHKLRKFTRHLNIKLDSISLSDKAVSLLELVELLQPYIEYKIDVVDLTHAIVAKSVRKFSVDKSPSNALNFTPEPKDLEKDFEDLIQKSADYIDRELGAPEVVFKKIDILRLKKSIVKRFDDDAKDLRRALERVDQLEKAKQKDLEKLRMTNENDQRQISELLRQNKELRRTVKRQDRRIKALEPQVAELNDVRHENEQLNKSLQEANKQVADLQNTISRERQSFSNYQSLQNDLKSTKGHLDEARNSTRRAEAQLSTERKSHSAAIKAAERRHRDAERTWTHHAQAQLATERESHSAAIKAEKERACKAEISQLDVTLDFGIRALERARDICIEEIETTEGRLLPALAVQREVMIKNYAIWTTTLDEVKNLIESTRNNHQQLVNDLKKGKSLASLDKFVVPPPPPCPKLHQIPTLPQPQPQQRPISPIGPIRRSPQHHMYSASAASAVPSFNVFTRSGFDHSQHGDLDVLRFNDNG